MLPFFSLGPGRHYFSNGTEHGYCTIIDRQHTVNPFVAVVVVVVLAIVVIVVCVVDVVLQHLYLKLVRKVIIKIEIIIGYAL